LFVISNCILILLWAVYLFAVQMLDPHNLERERQIRYTPLKEIQTATRGYIFDRNQELLVRTAKFYQIDYDRSTLKSYQDNNNQLLSEDYSLIASIISSQSSLSHQYVLSRLKSSGGGASIYLSDRIRESEIVLIERQLKEHKIHRGLVTSFSFQQRVYPQGELAARLLGAVRNTKDSGTDALLSQLQGICGIEATYDEDLSGAYGWQMRLFDARNNPVLIPNLGKQRVTNGNNLVLTIDTRIQEIVEMNLREDIETFKAKNAIAILMDPKTGEILALSNISSSDDRYNPSEIRVMANMAASFMFEPGSTIKPFTTLAALEKKMFKTTDIIDCRTYKTEHKRTIKDSHPFEDLSFKDVLVHSSNVGTCKIADRIGANYLYEQLIAFGFGNRTGSDIYGETAGLLRKVRDWQGYSLHSISFGQEIAVTPLQLITAYAALANDGNLMRPYLVKMITDENDQVVKRNKPRRIRTVSNKSCLDTLKTYLQGAVEYGTATSTNLPYISIAGKTGTAEKQSDGQAGYGRNSYISNFVGFFPAEDPQFVGLVLYDEPEYYYHYASMSAVVTFRKITEQILALPDCRIVPQLRMQEMSIVSMPDLLGLELSKAKDVLAKNNINYQLTGVVESDNSVVVNQFPKHEIKFDKNQTVVIVADIMKKEETVNTDESELISKMPSLIGLTLRQAVKEAKKQQINIEVEGKGIVFSQSIPVGKPVEYGLTCIVKAN